MLTALLFSTACDNKRGNAAEALKTSLPERVEAPAAVPIAQPIALATAEPLNDDRRVAAIFTANHADKSLDEKLPALEDFISSRITENGFSTISREVATGALSSLVKDGKQTEIERMLDNNSSVLRLSQMLGANYIIMATISSYGADKQTTEAYGVKMVNVTYSLRVTYKVLDGVQGSTLTGDTIKVSSTKRFTENSRSESTTIVDDLLDEASLKIAAGAAKKQIKPIVASTRLVEFSIACGMQDNAQLPLSVPDIRLTKDNAVVVGNERIPVQALNVMVELDGAGIGSTPAVFKVPSGLHKIRLRRDGFKDYEGMITVSQGQVFNIALQMTDAGYQRWKDNTAFLDSLVKGKILTDAEAEKVRGEAQMLRQSGNLVNIKVDTKENVHPIYKSIY